MVNVQIYSGMWIKLPQKIKDRVVELFSIPRQGATHVVDGELVSDGYLDKDLAILNVPNLQNYLNSKEEDIFKLWTKMLKQVTEELEPPKEVAKEESPNIEMNVNIGGENVKLTGKLKQNARTKASQ